MLCVISFLESAAIICYRLPLPATAAATETATAVAAAATALQLSAATAAASAGMLGATSNSTSPTMKS